MQKCQIITKIMFSQAHQKAEVIKQPCKHHFGIAEEQNTIHLLRVFFYELLPGAYGKDWGQGMR